VGDGALLEWLPDPIIPFAGSRSRIETSIELGDDCGLFWWEVVAPGRVAHEELFAYDLLDVQFDIRATGVPIAMEHYRIEPAARSLASQVRMGPYRYLTTFYICRTGQAPTIWLALEEELRGIVMAHSRQHREFWGASTLSAHGIVVKGLSNSALRVNEALFAIWNAAKLRLYGTEAVAPRKVP
jgi:urease accessory protein